MRERDRVDVCDRRMCLLVLTFISIPLPRPTENRREREIMVCEGRRDRLVKSYGCSIPPSPIFSLLSVPLPILTGEKGKEIGKREKGRGKDAIGGYMVKRKMPPMKVKEVTVGLTNT